MENMFFGKYPQGANGEVLPIEWICLSDSDDELIYVSRKVIDCIPFNDGGKVCSWESCSLRAKLNGEFLKTAFSDEEKARISNVFLLDNNQAGKYFSSNDDRTAEATEYAVSKGAKVYDGNGKTYWWLRSMTSRHSHASFVSYDGIIFWLGRNVGANGYGVRPVISVKR